jgi:hypothetical protein
MTDDRNRELYAGLHLLDRQLKDRHDHLCGKVDDLELGPLGDGGDLYVTGLYTGPGALLTRLGMPKIGAWVRRAITGDEVGSESDETLVPFAKVRDIGDHLTLGLDAEELATHDAERWTRDHVVAHIPGSDRDAAE